MPVTNSNDDPTKKNSSPQQTTPTITTTTKKGKKLDPEAGIKFSERVDKALQDVLPSTDIFDSPTFNPIEYLNNYFPNEQSLSNLDPFLLKVKKKVRQVDDDILNAVRRQTTSGDKARQDLSDSKQAILNLFSKVQDIKKKAEQSEAMVQEICRDIKSLDYAKRNLTTTITALKRLHMLASGVEQLKDMSAKKQYKQVADLLMATTQLSQEFSGYTSIGKVKELCDHIAGTRQILERQMTEEFNRVGVYSEKAMKEDNAAQLNALSEACMVVDALGTEFREKIVNHFVKHIINLYEMVYIPSSKDYSLEHVDKRYTWLKRQLKNYEERYSTVFPQGWCVPQEICMDFCVTTSQVVVNLLQSSGDRIGVDLLRKVVLKTLDFEKYLQTRFAVYHSNAADAQVLDEDEVSPDENTDNIDIKSADGVKKKYHIIARNQERQRRRDERNAKLKNLTELANNYSNTKLEHTTHKSFIFTGIISKHFEKYFGAYISCEDSDLNDKIQEALREERWEPVDGGSTLKSSGELFIVLRASLSKTIPLSRGKLLYDLHMVWKKHLSNYAHALINRLPKAAQQSTTTPTTTGSIMKFITMDNNTSSSNNNLTVDSDASKLIKLTEHDEVCVCTIINTANYWSSCIEGFADEITTTIEDEYRDKIDLSDEKELFIGVISRCAEVLTSGIESKLETPLQTMIKTQWSSFHAVGDQSEYMNQVFVILSESFSFVTSKIVSQRFKFFCDKFVSSFIPRFVTYIYKCKSISEEGAQQLLLDLQSLKKFLETLPNTESEMLTENQLVSYNAIVQREISKGERLLKIVATPYQGVVESFKSLMPNATGATLQKILDLKGLRKNEQSQLLAQFSSLSKSDEGSHGPMGLFPKIFSN